MMMRFGIIILLFSMVGFISCRNKKAIDVTAPEITFFDYKITGNEGDDKLTVLLQYREEDEEGIAFALLTPSKVMLDNELIIADSAGMTGAFYEIYKPIDSFIGKHNIVFTDFNKKEYKEDFEFQPVSLITALPDTVHREDLLLELAGLDAEDYVRLVLTDTVFSNDGINQVDTVRDGRIIISAYDLKKLANGPIQFELIREYERPVKNGTEAGGRLIINYSLKREFLLQD